MEENRSAAAYIKLAISIAVGILVSWALKGKIGSILLPLVLSYVGARIASPGAKFLSRTCRINPKVGGAVYALLVCGGVIYITAAVSHRLIDELWSILEELPEYAESAVSITGNLIDKLPFSPTLKGGKWSTLLLTATGKLTEYVGTAAAKFLGNTVQSFPKLMMSSLVGIVGFVYLTADMDGAVRCVLSIVPKKYSAKFKSTAKDVSGALFSYLRAYATLSSVTFLILSVGLAVIGAENSMASALIIAVIDALPMLGCGVVMIPWTIICFLSGELTRGIGLIVILGIIYIVRQLLEPRIIGKMTGVHPFLALACVFVGLKLGGIGGMIVSPIILSCVVQMLRARGE